MEEYAANINRLTLREREARSEVRAPKTSQAARPLPLLLTLPFKPQTETNPQQVNAVRALLVRFGAFYSEVLPVKYMGYVDYEEVRKQKAKRR